MNGRLHLGHAFTLTKSDFMAGYQRLLGKRVLFPFGFHCTGMPIMACADRLKRELQEEAVPSSAASSSSEVSAESKESLPVGPVSQEVDPSRFKGKKSKAVAKKGVGLSQSDILREMSIPDEEIPAFQDPLHWLHYFPPIGMADLKRFGVSVDWRRSFITTSANPFYDSFVRWQFNRLRAEGRIAFGNRPSIFCIRDHQPCADHDRSSGEGVQPQEYTIIKMRVLSVDGCHALEPLKDKVIFLAAATLRPETMYGQTNCWVGVDVDYGAFEMADGSVFICTLRAMMNMSYQNMTAVNGEWKLLTSMKGKELIGLPLKAPLSVYPRIHVLPMSRVSSTKGTGVVTSVPSDSPDDFICFKLLKDSAAKRAHFEVKDEWVLPFDVVPIIDVPELGGSCAAGRVCEELKIVSDKESDKLAIAHERVYSTGFYKGVMLVGEHKGKRVADAKPLVKTALVACGEATTYFEPESLVMSRSGEECIVALTDQWYLKYGDPAWKAPVEKHVREGMHVYNPSVQKGILETVSWLNEWACSRSYGLGSFLPWDRSVVIESLSDSTIYMAYYTVSHLLQGNLDGSVLGPLGIRSDQMTDAVWDFVLLGKGDPSTLGIPRIAELRNEFLAWYPVDLRVSGKDLIQNHLTMFLFNHAACLPDFLPRGINCNGHIMVNGEKMSKSIGNFLTMSWCCGEYSADATRFALSDAGDSLDDANFLQGTADSAILKLTKELQWLEEMKDAVTKGHLRSGPITLFADRVFQSAMARCTEEGSQGFESMRYRDALRACFHDMTSARDRYKSAVGMDMHADLANQYIRFIAIMMSPITPHWADHIYRHVLGFSEAVVTAKWPRGLPIDDVTLLQDERLESLCHDIRVFLERKQKTESRKGGVPTPANCLAVYVSKGYTPIQVRALEVLLKFYDRSGKAFADGVTEALKNDEILKTQLKIVMPFAANRMAEAKTKGIHSLDVATRYDEFGFLSEHSAEIAAAIGVKSICLFYRDDEAAPDPLNKKAAALPMNPTFATIDAPKA